MHKKFFAQSETFARRHLAQKLFCMEGHFCTTLKIKIKLKEKYNSRKKNKN